MLGEHLSSPGVGLAEEHMPEAGVGEPVVEPSDPGEEGADIHQAAVSVRKCETAPYAGGSW
jgi:hypothetical protein